MEKDNSVGALITKNSIGKTFFSHKFAVNGGLVKIFIDGFNDAHTLYHTEYAMTDKSDELLNENACPGCGGVRHWQIIDLETAEKVIRIAWAKRIVNKRKALRAELIGKKEILEEIKKYKGEKEE